MGTWMREQGKGGNLRRDNYHKRHFEKPYGTLLLQKLPKIYTYYRDSLAPFTLQIYERNLNEVPV